MSDYPQLEWLIQNGNYLNSLITNSSLIITTRIRTIGQRARHIANKLTHMIGTYTHIDHRLIRIAKEFLRVFNTDGDYNRLERAMIRRGYMSDDNSSVEVQREEPRRHIHDPNLMLFLAYREWRRGDIDEDEYNSRRRWILEQTLRQRGLDFHVLAVENNLPDVMELERQILSRPPARARSPVNRDMPRLEEQSQSYSLNSFVENMITRSNIKITDWKEEKPDECPVCCGDCEEHPLSCGHYVCSDCIVNSKKATCPCCRQDVALDVPVYQRLYNAIHN